MQIIDCRQFTTSIVTVPENTFRQGKCLNANEFMTPPDAAGNKLVSPAMIDAAISTLSFQTPVIFDVELPEYNLRTMAAVAGLMRYYSHMEFGIYNAWPIVGPDALQATEAPFNVKSWLDKQRRITRILPNLSILTPCFYCTTNPQNDAKIMALIATALDDCDQIVMPFVSNRYAGLGGAGFVPKDQLWNTLTLCQNCFDGVVAWTNPEPETDSTFTQCLIDFAHM